MKSLERSFFVRESPTTRRTKKKKKKLQRSDNSQTTFCIIFILKPSFIVVHYRTLSRCAKLTLKGVFEKASLPSHSHSHPHTHAPSHTHTHTRTNTLTNTLFCLSLSYYWKECNSWFACVCVCVRAFASVCEGGRERERKEGRVGPYLCKQNNMRLNLVHIALFMVCLVFEFLVRNQNKQTELW